MQPMLSKGLKEEGWKLGGEIAVFIMIGTIIITVALLSRGVTGQAVESIKEKVTWTDNCEARCENGKCNTILGRTEWVNDTDDRCRQIKEAKSLKNGFYVETLKDDKVNSIEVIDFNYTCITIRPRTTDYNKEIPVKINDVAIGTVNYPSMFSTPKTIEICTETDGDLLITDKDTLNKYTDQRKWPESTLSMNFTFGSESTTIQLQDNETDMLGDVWIDNYGEEPGERPYNIIVKINITGIPEGQQIDESLLCAVDVNTEGRSCSGEITECNEVQAVCVYWDWIGEECCSEFGCGWNGTGCNGTTSVSCQDFDCDFPEEGTSCIMNENPTSCIMNENITSVSYRLENQSFQETDSSETFRQYATELGVNHTDAIEIGASEFCFNMTDLTSSDYQEGYENETIWITINGDITFNCSFVINIPDDMPVTDTDNTGLIYIKPREIPGGPYLYLNITYSEGGAGNCWTTESGKLTIPSRCRLEKEAGGKSET